MMTMPSSTWLLLPIWPPIATIQPMPLVAAEMIGATKGIGWMVAMGGQIGNSSQVLLGIVIIGCIAWLMESLVFRRIEQHYQTWRIQ